MAQWFECKIRYDKMSETGVLKRVTETYLVDALDFAEAERRFIEEMEPYMSGEYEVADIRKLKAAELFESQVADDRWYKARVAFISLDEKTGQEKLTKCDMLVQGPDLVRAVQNLEKGMEGTLGDYVLIGISEVPILDVFHFQGEEASVGS